VVGGTIVGGAPPTRGVEGKKTRGHIEERTGLELFVESTVSIAHNMGKAWRTQVSAQGGGLDHFAPEEKVVYH
jgi:hypothetical protein